MLACDATRAIQIWYVDIREQQDFHPKIGKRLKLYCKHLHQVTERTEFWEGSA